MYKHRRNVNFHLFFFIRHRFWPVIIPSISILFLIFCPKFSQSIEINENPDRTIAKLGPRNIQLTTTLSPLPFSKSTSPPTTTNFDELIHTLYVISLDGKITAIDAHSNGRQLWTADTGAPLVDSSLSKIEITRESRAVRLIPSLIGGLYEKYEEDGHVEPLPFDADALLDSSFKLHDELVITGGKHIDTLGLDLRTGRILYSFSKDDPKQENTLDNNRTTTQTTNDDVETQATLIVKRTTQTVRARSVRNGYEKWNFSVSNHELLHLHVQPTPIILGQVHQQNEKRFSGYFEYQLQTGVVLAFDDNGHFLWSSAINAPIAAVWELKNGKLNEKSLFETTMSNHFPKDDSQDDENFSQPLISRRLAFIGEFNSTPYVIVSPNIQKELIYDAKKNTIAGTIGNNRPVLYSWQKAYQKRTLSLGSETGENQHLHRAIGVLPTEHNFPLALRPDPTGSHSSHSVHSSIDETCDTAGYLELINNPLIDLLDENNDNNIPDSTIIHSNIFTSINTVTIPTVLLSILFIIIIWFITQHYAQRYTNQRSITIESSKTTNGTPPLTPDYHQIDQPLTPLFQSRYTLEYEHVRFLGRGGFGVVFEAINKLDQRRVAIKRVSLKKASGKERALREIRCLAVLNHPNLIQYYYAWNESPPIGWQEEEDKQLLVRNNFNARDSISTFPTSAVSGNDSESNNQIRSPKLSSISAVYARKPSAASYPPLSEITSFNRSSNPLRIDEDFSTHSDNNNVKSETSSSSSSSSSSEDDKDLNNNGPTKRRASTRTTKSSLSSSSPLFDHSSDSSSFNSNDKHLNNEISESDDGIVFLHDDKRSASPIQTQTKSSIEKVKTLSTNEKDLPTTYFYFVMELCQPESLRDRLIQRTIDRYQAWSIFDQIVKGIEYIHSQKLIHRDLKPSNILFSMDNTVKIGDFGLVSAFGEEKLAKKMKRDEDKIDHNSYCETSSSITDACANNELGGTILYMSPEQMKRKPYNQKVDIYAMGIILFELLYPFSTQMERMHALTNVRLKSPAFPTDFECNRNNRSQLICRLIRWLLSESPSNRPRASELRHDKFYQSIFKLEAPHLSYNDNRQRNQTTVNEHDQTPMSQQRGRISSSPFRRSVSSSFLQSQFESKPDHIEHLH